MMGTVSKMGKYEHEGSMLKTSVMDNENVPSSFREENGFSESKASGQNRNGPEIFDLSDDYDVMNEDFVDKQFSAIDRETSKDIEENDFSGRVTSPEDFGSKYSVFQKNISTSCYHGTNSIETSEYTHVDVISGRSSKCSFSTKFEIPSSSSNDCILQGYQNGFGSFGENNYSDVEDKESCSFSIKNHSHLEDAPPNYNCRTSSSIDQLIGDILKPSEPTQTMRRSHDLNESDTKNSVNELNVFDNTDTQEKSVDVFSKKTGKASNNDKLDDNEAHVVHGKESSFSPDKNSQMTVFVPLVSLNVEELQDIKTHNVVNTQKDTKFSTMSYNDAPEEIQDSFQQTSRCFTDSKQNDPKRHYSEKRIYFDYNNTSSTRNNTEDQVTSVKSPRFLAVENSRLHEELSALSEEYSKLKHLYENIVNRNDIEMKALRGEIKNLRCCLSAKETIIDDLRSREIVGNNMIGNFGEVLGNNNVDYSDSPFAYEKQKTKNYLKNISKRILYKEPHQGDFLSNSEALYRKSFGSVSGSQECLTEKADYTFDNKRFNKSAYETNYSLDSLQSNKSQRKKITKKKYFQPSVIVDSKIENIETYLKTQKMLLAEASEINNNHHNYINSKIIVNRKPLSEYRSQTDCINEKQASEKRNELINSIQFNQQGTRCRGLSIPSTSNIGKRGIGSLQDKKNDSFVHNRDTTRSSSSTYTMSRTSTQDELLLPGKKQTRKQNDEFVISLENQKDFTKSIALVSPQRDSISSCEIVEKICSKNKGNYNSINNSSCSRHTTNKFSNYNNNSKLKSLANYNSCSNDSRIFSNTKKKIAESGYLFCENKNQENNVNIFNESDPYSNHICSNEQISSKNEMSKKSDNIIKSSSSCSSSYLAESNEEKTSMQKPRIRNKDSMYLQYKTKSNQKRNSVTKQKAIPIYQSGINKSSDGCSKSEEVLPIVNGKKFFEISGRKIDLFDEAKKNSQKEFTKKNSQFYNLNSKFNNMDGKMVDRAFDIIGNDLKEPIVSKNTNLEDVLPLREVFEINSDTFSIPICEIPSKVTKPKVTQENEIDSNKNASAILNESYTVEKKTGVEIQIPVVTNNFIDRNEDQFLKTQFLNESSTEKKNILSNEDFVEKEMMVDSIKTDGSIPNLIKENIIADYSNNKGYTDNKKNDNININIDVNKKTNEDYNNEDNNNQNNNIQHDNSTIILAEEATTRIGSRRFESDYKSEAKRSKSCGPTVPKEPCINPLNSKEKKLRNQTAAVVCSQQLGVTQNKISHFHSPIFNSNFSNDLLHHNLPNSYRSVDKNVQKPKFYLNTLFQNDHSAYLGIPHFPIKNIHSYSNVDTPLLNQKKNSGSLLPTKLNNQVFEKSVFESPHKCFFNQSLIVPNKQYQTTKWSGYSPCFHRRTNPNNTLTFLNAVSEGIQDIHKDVPSKSCCKPKYTYHLVYPKNSQYEMKNDETQSLMKTLEQTKCEEQSKNDHKSGTMPSISLFEIHKNHKEIKKDSSLDQKKQPNDSMAEKHIIQPSTKIVPCKNTLTLPKQTYSRENKEKNIVQFADRKQYEKQKCAACLVHKHEQNGNEKSSTIEVPSHKSLQNTHTNRNSKNFHEMPRGQINDSNRHLSLCDGTKNAGHIQNETKRKSFGFTDRPVIQDHPLTVSYDTGSTQTSNMNLFNNNFSSNVPVVNSQISGFNYPEISPTHRSSRVRRSRTINTGTPSSENWFQPARSIRRFQTGACRNCQQLQAGPHPGGRTPCFPSNRSTPPFFYPFQTLSPEFTPIPYMKLGTVSQSTFRPIFRKNFVR